VVVELGAQSGLIIPLIAVHLFVFYYGIMGDITPPVGLATFAAAAISGEDAIKTGIQGSVYALRTVILPFIWIFNPTLLLIDTGAWWDVVLVVLASTIAMLAFAAITMNWMRVRCKAWELAALIVATAFLFRPDYFMDFVAPEYKSASATEAFKVAGALPADDRLVAVIAGTTIEGDELKKTVALNLGPNLGNSEADGRRRLNAAGLTVVPLGDKLQIANVKFGSAAKKSGFEQGFEIVELKVPSGRPSAHWFYLPGFLLIALVWWVQGRRLAGS
jgi:hypothetical protein